MKHNRSWWSFESKLCEIAARSSLQILTPLTKNYVFEDEYQLRNCKITRNGSIM